MLHHYSYYIGVTLHHDYIVSLPGAFDLWLLPLSHWLHSRAQGRVGLVGAKVLYPHHPPLPNMQELWQAGSSEQSTQHSNPADTEGGRAWMKK